MHTYSFWGLFVAPFDQLAACFPPIAGSLVFVFGGAGGESQVWIWLGHKLQDYRNKAAHLHGFLLRKVRAPRDESGSGG